MTNFLHPFGSSKLTPCLAKLNLKSEGKLNNDMPMIGSGRGWGSDNCSTHIVHIKVENTVHVLGIFDQLTALFINISVSCKKFNMPINAPPA